MEIEIITKRDLDAFGQKLLQDLTLILGQKRIESDKEYLRSKEARQMLGGISAGTLQSLRIKGVLKPTKIEGVYYYKLAEIKALLSGGE